MFDYLGFISFFLVIPLIANSIVFWVAVVAGLLILLSALVNEVWRRATRRY